MSTFVIDASIAAKWYLEEEHTEAALRLLEPGHRLHAPDFMLLEIDNVLCKRIRRGTIIPGKADRIRATLRSYPILYTGIASLQERAYMIAKQTRRGVYDCLYVALAVRLGEQLVTADRRLFDGLVGTPFAEYVMWVEDMGVADARPTPMQRGATRKKGKRRRGGGRKGAT